MLGCGAFSILTTPEIIRAPLTQPTTCYHLHHSQQPSGNLFQGSKTKLVGWVEQAVSLYVEFRSSTQHHLES